MTGGEIFLAMAGAVGLAEIVKTLVERLVRKKHYGIADKKDEFSALRERLDYNEKEINGLMKQQAINNRRIARMYNFIAEMVMQTCAKTGCKMRKIIEVNFDSFDEEWEQFEEKPQEGQDVEE